MISHHERRKRVTFEGVIQIKCQIPFIFTELNLRILSLTFSIVLFGVVQSSCYWWGHASSENWCPICHRSSLPRSPKYTRSRARTAKETKFKHSHTTSYKNTADKVSALQNPLLKDSLHKTSYLITRTPIDP